MSKKQKKNGNKAELEKLKLITAIITLIADAINIATMIIAMMNN